MKNILTLILALSLFGGVMSFEDITVNIVKLSAIIILVFCGEHILQTRCLNI